MKNDYALPFYTLTLCLNRVKPLKIAAARTSRLLKFLILVSGISSARICLLIKLTQNYSHGNIRLQIMLCLCTVSMFFIP